jgi:hypothetical protein
MAATRSTASWQNLARALKRAEREKRTVICHPDQREQVEQAIRLTTHDSGGWIHICTSPAVAGGIAILVLPYNGAVDIQPDGCDTQGMWGRCRLPAGHPGAPRTCDCPPMPDWPEED